MARTKHQIPGGAAGVMKASGGLPVGRGEGNAHERRGGWFARPGERLDTYQASAHVRFARPGRLRVDGALASSGKFAIVCDGNTVWSTVTPDFGKWQKEESAEMAIAGFTGITMDAATTIPAILTHCNWGNPFRRPGVVKRKAVLQRYGGHSTYRVEATTPTGTVTYLVDAQTMLLREIRTKIDLDKVPLPPVNDKRRKQKPAGTWLSVERFTDTRVNPGINPAIFARPDGAPK